MRLLLIRHTHAGVRGTWPGNDLDRQLSDRGREQAAALVEQFADEEVAAVHSSRAVRCVESVRPLAEARGLEVQTVPALLEGARPAEALAWLEGLTTNGTVAACSHGDVIGGVVRRLDRRGTSLDGDRSWPKGGTWVLEVEDGLVTHGRLLAPPAV